MNLVERRFKELTDKRLRRGVFTSVADLGQGDHHLGRAMEQAVGEQRNEESRQQSSPGTFGR